MPNRRFSHVVLLLCLLLTACLAQAAFTRPALWKLDSIDETYAGTWCFHPGPNPTFASACANATLNALLNIHLRNDFGSGLSVAYYDLKDGSVLGGAGWAHWDAVTLPVGTCMTGRVNGLDDTFSTTCRFAIADNDHEIASAHTMECTVNRAQLRVTDGCYAPPPHRPWFRLDDSISNLLTILGFIIALPVFGIYRWYRARRKQQQARNEDGQIMPLAGLGSGAAIANANHGASDPESALIAG